MRGRRVVAMAAVVSLGLASPALATMVLHLEIEDLIPLSPLVVVGQVNTIEASWNADRTKIYTRVSVTVEEQLRGSAAAAVVEIKLIGGNVDGTLAEMPGAPRFEPGERVLLFLEPRKDSDGYLPVGLFQGKFQVFRDPKSGLDLLLRDEPGRGVTVVGGTAKVQAARSLREVRALCKGGAL